MRSLSLLQVLLGFLLIVSLSVSAVEASPSTPSPIAKLLECTACTAAINEVEGLLNENVTQSEIITRLQTGFCSLLGGTQEFFCDQLVAGLPVVIEMIEKKIGRPSKFCHSLGLCTSPFDYGSDGAPLPSFVFDLDLAPRQRWIPILKANPKALAVIRDFWVHLKDVQPALLEAALTLGEQVLKYIPHEWSEEIIGFSQYSQLPPGLIGFLNMGYDLSTACTSIVAAKVDGTPVHARNLDFLFGFDGTQFLRQLAVTLDYQKNGTTLFVSEGIMGYSGILTGYVPSGFTLTVNTRNDPKGIRSLYTDAIDLMEKGYLLPTFLTRKVLTSESSYSGALSALTTDAIVAPVYYTLGGSKSYEGAVITRNRLGIDHEVRSLSATNWYQLQTNYDYWLPAPWYDDRRDQAIASMDLMGRSGLSWPNLYKVLSTQPVLNRLTIYSVLMSSEEKYVEVKGRVCQDPCPF